MEAVQSGQASIFSFIYQVVGGLIGTVTSSKNGLVDRYSDMYCRNDIPQDLNDSFAGFGRADNRKNAPASYGMVISFYTRTKGNYICAQFFISDIGTIYGRMKWETNLIVKIKIV